MNYSHIIMKPSHIFLLSISSFSNGLLAPTITLIFLSHGASLDNLWLVIFAFSLTVVVLEVPSGILADQLGKDCIFLFSHFLFLVSLILLLISNTLAILIITVIFLGISRSFSSGSFEALVVDDYIVKYGTTRIENLNSTFLIIECIANSLGSLIGGILAFGGKKYHMLLYSNITLEICVLIGILLTLHCKPKFNLSTNSIRISQTLNNLIHIPSITPIVLYSIPLGMIASSLELYWQPIIKDFLPSNLLWILGFITFFTYYFAIIGGLLGGIAIRFTEKYRFNKIKVLQFSCVLYAVISIMLMIVADWYTFLVIFGACYILLGASNLIQSSILHTIVQDQSRATALSLISLLTKVGGVVTSIIARPVLKIFGISSIWLYTGMFSIMLILLMPNLTKKR